VAVSPSREVVEALVELRATKGGAYVIEGKRAGEDKMEGQGISEEITKGLTRF